MVVAVAVADTHSKCCLCYRTITSTSTAFLHTSGSTLQKLAASLEEKELSPETGISASDEYQYVTAIDTFQQYGSALDVIDQVNTHGYKGTPHTLSECACPMAVDCLAVAQGFLQRVAFEASLLACLPQEGRSQPDSLPLGVVLTRMGMRAQGPWGSKRIMGVAGEGIHVRGTSMNMPEVLCHIKHNTHY